MPSLPFASSSTFDQGVEDDVEMVYKRVRDDGVSKKNKLRTDSIRARLASLPSRSMGDGTIVMQIKGRAAASSRTSRRMEDAGQRSTRSSIVDQVENRSHVSPSKSSKTASRRGIVSTKASLGNLYPPLSPSNTSSDLKANPQASSSTDIGPRCSTPSQQHVSAAPPAVVEAPTTDTPDTSRYTTIHERPLAAAMNPNTSAATVRGFDLFDDDDDDDAMRRLCRSPVLLPSNSMAATFHDLIPVNSAHASYQPSKASSKVDREDLQHGQTSVPDAKDAATIASLRRYEVLKPSSSPSTSRSPPATKQAMRPDQPVNRSPLVPGSAVGYDESSDGPPYTVDNKVTGSKAPSTQNMQTVSPSAISEAALSPIISKKPGAILSDHIAMLDSVFGDTNKRALPLLVASIAATQPAHRSAPSGNARVKSTQVGARKTTNLPDKIAFLESLLLGSEPSRSSSGSPKSMATPLQASPPLEEHQVRPAPVQDEMPPHSITQTMQTLPHLKGNYSLPHRRASSASSQSYEPASPARSTTPEFEEFAPGEFVVSADTLHASAIQSRAFQFTMQSEAAEVVKDEPKDDEDDDRPADIPHLNARELPPNMPVPAMNHHSSRSSRFNAYTEIARAQPVPPTLRHPQPRRGTSTPTASMLEETAAMKTVQAADLSLEYEDEPVDIAARNVKARRESTTKVKFAETEDKQADKQADKHVKEDDEEDTSDSGSGSDVAYPNMSSPVKRGSSPTSKTKEPVPQFEFVETDILKGLSMPSLARRSSYSSSDTSDSDSQPESPAENAPVALVLQKKPIIMEEEITSQVKQAVASVSVLPISTVARPNSEASSRSASPAGRSDTSDSSNSNGGRDGIRAASKMSAPPIRVGGSLMKKGGRKAGHYGPPPQRSANRYGMHSGYSGPKRNFRTFEFPEHIAADSGWRNNDGVVFKQTAINPETAYDVAQMEGGNVALASFLENYETPLEREMSSKADLLVPEPSYNSKSKGSSKRMENGESSQNVTDRPELDIFDDLLL